ncbi:glucose dehydrogenase [FAD, quinone]-like [Mya arenaria]|uniref:glucose dehydrogenase [FAD, quinone]-like n=1 Tax=Mya arenaria TaxID=6604 RepID=UPI0022E435A5|nr:glucose dehydrogenase [FAD, quinone]-like [Mya arenaria]XP_052776663.1 glucose dehydrogenase [FAD, quinone]-like [Mya arenaria]
MFLKLLLVGILTAYFWRYFYYPEPESIISDTFKEEYDYVVVGAGTAGSVVAARLAEDAGASILLLEAGGHFDESKLTSWASGWIALFTSSFDWGYYTESEKDVFKGLAGKRSYWPRGKALGGTGVLNGMQYTRGSRFDYDGWAENGCVGWDYKSVLPYFLKSEDIQIPELYSSSIYHRRGGPIAVTYSPPSDLTPLVLKAGSELGYNVTDYNGELQEGFSVVQSTLRNGIRSSTAHEFIAKEKRHNLDIVTRSFVTKIFIQDKKANGVFFIRNGRKQYVKARKEIIVSTGAVNTPQLLMLSGIGPSKDLQKLDIEVVQDLPVGKNLQDHQITILPTPVKENVGPTWADLMSKWSELMYDYLKTGPLARTGLDGSAFLHIDKAKIGKSAPDIQIIFFNFLFGENFLNFEDRIAQELMEKDFNKHGFVTDICTTRPKSRGSIKLRSADPFDYPLIHANYYSNYEDIKTVLGGIRIWEKLMETDTFREIGVDTSKTKVSFCSQFEYRSDAYWECYIRHISTTEYHPCCTAPMGPDNDNSAVLDLKLRVRGIANLRVVDASVFPNITSGNINAPTVMVAEKAADMIRGIDTVGEFKNRV